MLDDKKENRENDDIISDEERKFNSKIKNAKGEAEENRDGESHQSRWLAKGKGRLP